MGGMAEAGVHRRTESDKGITSGTKTECLGLNIPSQLVVPMSPVPHHARWTHRFHPHALTCPLQPLTPHQIQPPMTFVVTIQMSPDEEPPPLDTEAKEEMIDEEPF